MIQQIVHYQSSLLRAEMFGFISGLTHADVSCSPYYLRGRLKRWSRPFIFGLGARFPAPHVYFLKHLKARQWTLRCFWWTVFFNFIASITAYHGLGTYCLFKDPATWGTVNWPSWGYSICFSIKNYSFNLQDKIREWHEAHKEQLMGEHP